MPTDLGRVRGSFIFNGSSNTSAAIKAELQAAGKISLNGDIYICNSQGNHPYFIYNSSNQTWEQKGTISGVDNFDTQMDVNSTNAVQNKVVAQILAGVADGTNVVGKSKKLTGLGSSFTMYNWGSNWYTNGFTWQIGDVYELRIGNGTSTYFQTVGIFHINISPTDTSAVFYSPIFAFPGKGLFAIKFCKKDTGASMVLCKLNPSTGDFTEQTSGMGVSWYSYIRKVQDN